MNLLACDRDPYHAATALADQHLVRMCIEVPQILSAVGEALKRPFYGAYPIQAPKDPAVVAAVNCPHFRTWLWTFGTAVSFEFQHRFARENRAGEVTRQAEVLLEVPGGRLTWALAEFPSTRFVDEKDPVSSCREYLREEYADWATAGSPPMWTNAESPPWLRYLVCVSAA